MPLGKKIQGHFCYNSDILYTNFEVIYSKWLNGFLFNSKLSLRFLGKKSFTESCPIGSKRFEFIVLLEANNLFHQKQEKGEYPFVCFLFSFSFPKQ